MITFEQLFDDLESDKLPMNFMLFMKYNNLSH